MLGFAHHLTSKRLLDPPCMLPKLPQSGIIKEPAVSDGINLLGVMTKHINVFLAPVRRHRTEKTIGQMGDTACTSGSQQRGPAAKNGRQLLNSNGPLSYLDKPADRGEPMSTSRWYSAEKNLCERCWALRTGASALGGSTCQRCGHTHRRGYSQDVSNRGGAGDKTVGPVPWQQFSQVRRFVVLLPLW